MNSKLSGKTAEELFYLGKIVDRILAHYDNQMQANNGNYSTAFQQEEYLKAKAKRDLYTVFKEEIVEAMENVAISAIADSKQLIAYKSKIEKIENDEKNMAKC